MEYSDKELQKDVERIRQIGIIPTLLDVICQLTGMGFAAVARVTDSRWITCSVRDDIQFGLVPGSELRLETTICNDIRDSYSPVVIDHVSESTLFRNHPTPLMYGFQSYISFPIILKTGEFFGTLCAIDPQPRNVENPAIMGMFSAFSDLISFHLQQVQMLEERDNAVKSLNRQLTGYVDEIRQYRHISSHTLQEPLRKLRVFSEMLLDALQVQQLDDAKLLAQRIQKGAMRFSGLIADLSDFANIEDEHTVFKVVDLEYINNVVAAKLRSALDAKDATVTIGPIPKVKAIPEQMEQLFFQLFDNAIKFAKPDVPLCIQVTSEDYISEANAALLPAKNYIRIMFSDNGIGIEPSQLDTIFDVFSKLPTEIFLEGSGIGLSISRKIIRNHSGLITIQSEPGIGTTVSMILPTD
ncbi:GAF domain-containing protein [Dyadobacter sandarakinus]|uniref:histidine kinase n=2 Tax=Dyadobacter sandarakinus TaxID=2747268 RepID=A0ABX7IDB4_9BACT|nr:GAF domain-containing protein [Dyadobacter sandarakinus]